MDIQKLKREWFLEPSIKRNGYAFFIIRRTLLKAVDELRSQISGKVLDLGCGIMPYKEYLMESGKIYEYLGIDLEPTEYHNTVKPNLYWNGKEIPTSDNQFDWVIATEFLEHYYDTTNIVKEIKRVLRPGGKFFFTVPCIWPLHEVPYDEYRFTPYSLTKIFQEAGFKKIEIKPLGGTNISRVIVFGHWYDNLRIRYKLILRPIIRPIMKKLISNDKPDYQFRNGFMPSGLYGFIEKDSN